MVALWSVSVNEVIWSAMMEEVVAEIYGTKMKVDDGDDYYYDDGGDVNGYEQQ